jgi:hypothetical protein
MGFPEGRVVEARIAGELQVFGLPGHLYALRPVGVPSSRREERRYRRGEKTVASARGRPPKSGSTPVRKPNDVAFGKPGDVVQTDTPALAILPGRTIQPFTAYDPFAEETQPSHIS